MENKHAPMERVHARHFRATPTETEKQRKHSENNHLQSLYSIILFSNSHINTASILFFPCSLQLTVHARQGNVRIRCMHISRLILTNKHFNFNLHFQSSLPFIWVSLRCESRQKSWKKVTNVCALVSFRTIQADNKQRKSAICNSKLASGIHSHGVTASAKHITAMRQARQRMRERKWKS